MSTPRIKVNKLMKNLLAALAATFLICSLAGLPALAEDDSSADETVATEETPRTEPGTVDLTGQWVLNEKLSEQPTPPQRPERRQGGGGQGGGPGGGMGGGPGGGMGGGPGGGMGGGMGGGRGGGRGGGMSRGGGQDDDSDSRQQQIARQMEELKKAKSSLEIYQEGLELNITDGLDITQLFYTDNRKTTIWTPRGEATATAHWEDAALLIEVQGQRDPGASVRTMQLNEDGSRLIVTESRPLPGQKKNMQIKLVYDRK